MTVVTLLRVPASYAKGYDLCRVCVAERFPESQEARR